MFFRPLSLQQWMNDSLLSCVLSAPSISSSSFSSYTCPFLDFLWQWIILLILFLFFSFYSSLALYSPRHRSGSPWAAQLSPRWRRPQMKLCRCSFSWNPERMPDCLFHFSLCAFSSHFLPIANFFLRCLASPLAPVLHHDVFFFPGGSPHSALLFPKRNSDTIL